MPWWSDRNKNLQNFSQNFEKTSMVEDRLREGTQKLSDRSS